jgi:hypothetical protein
VKLHRRSVESPERSRRVLNGINNCIAIFNAVFVTIQSRYKALEIL